MPSPASNTAASPGFQLDKLRQISMFHHIQSIGDAAANRGRHFDKVLPEISWPWIVGIHNELLTNTSE